MKLPANLKKKARIEIIPMIDTMFFLLVFFMIATLSMTIQHGMPVNLPTAESATDKIPDQISLTLTREGVLFFNKERIPLEELDSRIVRLPQSNSQPAFVINADEEVSHGRVIKVMDILRLAGISDIAIATKPHFEP